MAEQNIPLDQSTSYNLHYSGEIAGRPELSDTLDSSADSYEDILEVITPINLDGGEGPEEPGKVRYCLSIDEMPEYEFKDHGSARLFLQRLLETKTAALKKGSGHVEVVDDGEDRYRIVVPQRFMFLISYTYTIETYEIFQMTRVRRDNFKRALEAAA